MQQVMIEPITDQGSDLRPGSAPGKSTRSLIGNMTPARDAVAPHPRVAPGFIHSSPASWPLRYPDILCRDLTLGPHPASRRSWT